MNVIIWEFLCLVSSINSDTHAFVVAWACHLSISWWISRRWLEHTGVWPDSPARHMSSSIFLRSWHPPHAQLVYVNDGVKRDEGLPDHVHDRGSRSKSFASGSALIFSNLLVVMAVIPLSYLSWYVICSLRDMKPISKKKFRQMYSTIPKYLQRFHNHISMVHRSLVSCPRYPAR